MKSVFARRILAVPISILLLVLCVCSAYCSESFTDRFANFASNSVNKYALAGELSLLADGKNGPHEAIQGAKALAATAVVVQGLKFVVREKRPNSENLQSFPSGHTAEAFAMATVLADYHPKTAWIDYATAAAIGWSRVHLEQHHWQDVAAGAVIGHLIAKKFTGGNWGVTPTGALGYHSKF